MKKEYSKELDFIKIIKAFGQNMYGLDFRGAFEKVDLGEFSCNWVYACPSNELKSVFTNGRPYEFYPEEKKCMARYDELKAKGLDSYFYHAEAHGGGNCPVTKEMLEASGARKCYVIIHEAWHTTCKTESLGYSYPFEESSGRVVGLMGGIEFAKYLNDDNLLKATVDQEAAWSMFAEFINKSWDDLNVFYQKKPSDKEIASMKLELNQSAVELAEKMPDSWEKLELDKDINNAFVLRYHDYTVYYPQAKKIFLKYGNLADTIKHFKMSNFKEMI